MIDLIERLDRETEKRIKAFPHPNNRASEAGHPCVRFLVLSRLCAEKKALHDIGLQRIFDEGNLHERSMLRELEDTGIRLVEQQRPFEWAKFQLSGRIDAKISADGRLIPLEAKSCSQNIFPHIKSLEPTARAFLGSKHTWIRLYPAQIMLYCLMGGEAEGIIIFKNKGSGEKCQKNFHLDYEYAESILKKLEAVNDFVSKREIPPSELHEECKSCGFAKTVCFPDRDYGPGFEILTDQEWIEKLNRAEELRPSSEEREAIIEEIKEAFKGRQALIGDWKIESKEFERRNYKVPEEIKAQFVETSKYWVTRIERL